MTGGGKEEKWKCFGELVFLMPRRRQVRTISEELEEIKAIQDIPKALLEWRDEETERYPQSE